jgi:hypothetical protein
MHHQKTAERFTVDLAISMILAMALLLALIVVTQGSPLVRYCGDRGCRLWLTSLGGQRSRNQRDCPAQSGLVKKHVRQNGRGLPLAGRFMVSCSAANSL